MRDANCYNCKYHQKLHEDDSGACMHFCRYMGKIMSVDTLSEGCVDWLDKNEKWYDP